jgi:DnaJ-domain-containing protein 1
MEIDPRRLIAQLAVAVIAADGRIAADEVTALGCLNNLGLGRLSELVEEEMRSAVHRPIDVRAACALLRERLPAAAPVILAALATLAAADGDLSERELDMLGDAASQLGLAPAEAQHILASVFGPLQGAVGREPAPLPQPPRQPTQPEPVPPPVLAPGLAHALHVLGAAASANRADLDASYRRLIERYDPARVIDLGPDFATLAVRKLIEVTDAYELATHALEVQT